MRRCVAHSSAEAMYPEALEPGAVVAPGPVDPRVSVLAAHEASQALVDIAVDDGELPRRVAVAEVVTPALEGAVEVLHHRLQGLAHVGPIGRCSDLPPDGGHRLLGWPALQVEAPLPLPGLHLVKVEAEEVQALLSPGQTDGARLGLVEQEAKGAEHLGRAPPGLFGSAAFGADPDVIVASPRSQPLS